MDSVTLMDDSDVINAFVTHLRGYGYPELKVENRPDKNNRNSPDIDAIAGPLAIEHTSIDTLPGQRGESAQFMKAVGGIEKELHKKISFRLGISIEYAAVKKGQDWNAIRDGLKNWISNKVPHLKDGRYVLDGIPGVPFRLNVTKASDRPSGIFFSRYMPIDTTLPARVKAQFDRKAEKLSKYKPDKTTVLLIESRDIALMSESMALDVIRETYPNGLPAGVDQIWYADSPIPRAIEFGRVI